MAKGGFRPGSGRTKGVKNRSTIQKELIAAEIAARTVADAKKEGKKLAKEVLEEFMMLFAGMAAAYQPMPPGHAVPPGREPNEAKFLEYATLARDTAKALAPFQSPTFKAVAVSSMTPTGPQQPTPGDNAKIIDMNDQNMLARVYADMVRTTGR